MEDGAPVATLRFRDGLGPPQVKVEVEGEPSAEIAFGSGSFTITPGGLAGLLEHTARALAAIGALPNAPP
ncbi:MAG TPA: hypothetical protein VKC63_01270 [Solirubrobacterales bacterium]|nr:hypothetical protein [Solirubrobacterales bacterium]